MTDSTCHSSLKKGNSPYSGVRKKKLQKMIMHERTIGINRKKYLINILHLHFSEEKKGRHIEKVM